MAAVAAGVDLDATLEQGVELSAVGDHAVGQDERLTPLLLGVEQVRALHGDRRHPDGLARRCWRNHRSPPGDLGPGRVAPNSPPPKGHSVRRLLTVILALGLVAGACSDDSSDEATAPDEVSDAGDGAGGGSNSFCTDVVTKLMYLSQQSEEQFAEDVAFIEANLDGVGAEVQDAVNVIVAAEQAAMGGDTSLRLVPEYDDAQTTIAEHRADNC